MTVTIEVASEAFGATSTKRAVFLSQDHRTPEALEKAAVEFIRTARTANEEALKSYASTAAHET